jgi:hypothetical protein
VSTTRRTRRRQTGRWFIFYTLILVAIIAVSVWTQQWSVAITTLMITVVFVLYTRRLWRKR